MSYDFSLAGSHHHLIRPEFRRPTLSYAQDIIPIVLGLTMLFFNKYLFRELAKIHKKIWLEDFDQKKIQTLRIVGLCVGAALLVEGCYGLYLHHFAK